MIRRAVVSGLDAKTSSNILEAEKKKKKGENMTETSQAFLTSIQTKQPEDGCSTVARNDGKLPECT
jgi:hypothetical protein